MHWSIFFWIARLIQRYLRTAGVAMNGLPWVPDVVAGVVDVVAGVEVDVLLVETTPQDKQHEFNTALLQC